MNFFLKRSWRASILLLLVLACTKNINVSTEVEFQVLEEHVLEGFVNEYLPTTITILPEEELPDYEYFYTYTVSGGQGHLEDANGTPIDQGQKISFSSLSASLRYIVVLTYAINEIPITWTATSPQIQIAPGAVAAITLNFDSGADTANTTFEREYSIIEGAGTLTQADGSAVVLNGFVSIVPGVS